VKREPFRVVAKLRGPMMRPPHGIHLDALLMARVAVMECRDPIDWAGRAEREDPEIPIAMSECGRIYLASRSQFEVEARERQFVNRRFPMAEAQSIGAMSIKRIDVSAGESKGWRFPIELVHATRDEVVWYALGDMERTREILESVSNLGPKRSVGRGNVDSWDVSPIEPWEGFPVLRDGVPLRPLPLDWPGVTCQRRGLAVLKPPYFERWREEECAAW